MHYAQIEIQFLQINCASILIHSLETEEMSTQKQGQLIKNMEMFSMSKKRSSP